TDYAKGIVGGGHHDLGQPFVVAPQATIHGVGIWVFKYEMMLGDDRLAEAEMAPQIGIGGLARVGDYDDECDESGRIAQERGRERTRVDRSVHGKLLKGGGFPVKGTPGMRAADESARAKSVQCGSW